MNRAAAPLAIMGGAFDPVHAGHLRTAIELKAAVGFNELVFVPSGNPPHRAPHIASGELRVQMLEASTRDLPWCRVDDREIRRTGYSYTVDSLAEFRQAMQDRSLCLILGMDAFLGLISWHRWQEISQLAHLVIAHRPGWQPPMVGELGDFVRARHTTDRRDLHESPSGRVYIHSVTQLAISSSAIRAELSSGRDPRYLLPDAALSVAKQSGCYTNLDENSNQESRK